MALATDGVRLVSDLLLVSDGKAPTRKPTHAVIEDGGDYRALCRMAAPGGGWEIEAAEAGQVTCGLCLKSIRRIEAAKARRQPRAAISCVLCGKEIKPNESRISYRGGWAHQAPEKCSSGGIRRRRSAKP